MDSKHRHQLEQNVLAQWLVDQYEGWIRPNSHWLGYALLGVLAVIIIVVFTLRLNARNQALAWKQYYAALHSEQSETDLEMIASTTSGSVGVLARLTLAQQQLAEGCSQVFIDKVQAVTVLEKAVNSFGQTQKRAKDPSVLQQAGFGLGQCWEALAAARVGDDLVKAEEEYKKVAERWEDSFQGQRARQQLTLLRQPSTKKFMELAATKKAAPVGAGDFNVNIDPSDPFSPGQIDMSSFDQEPATAPVATTPVAVTPATNEALQPTEDAEEQKPAEETESELATEKPAEEDQSE